MHQTIGNRGERLSPRRAFNLLLSRNLFTVEDHARLINAIKDDAYWAMRYARDLLRTRWTLGEPAIARDALCAFMYARDVLFGRFEAGEPAIASNADLAMRYSDWHRMGRWLLAEPAIASDPRYAFSYWNRFVYGPWVIGENTIRQDPKMWQAYLDGAFLAPDTVFAQLMELARIDAIVHRSSNVIDGPWRPHAKGWAANGAGVFDWLADGLPEGVVLGPWL